MKKLYIFIFIFYSSYVSAQWTKINTNITETLSSVDFLDENRGLVCGGNKIWKSTDGGQGWVVVFTASDQVTLEEVVWVNNNIAVAVGFNFASNNSYIVRTTDAGSSWNTAFINQISLLTDIYFVNESLGFICGGNTTILKSVDGGANWTLSLNTNDSDLFSIFFTSADRGFAVGGIPGFARVLRTGNGGSTWHDSTDGSVSQLLLGVDFPTDSIGYAVGQLGFLMKSEDRGVSWSALNTTTNNDDILDVKFLDKNEGYIVGGTVQTASIQKTTDGGDTWNEEAPSSANGLYNMDITVGTAYAVGIDGTIVKKGVTTSVFSIQNDDYEIKAFPTLVSQNVTVESQNHTIQSVEIYDAGGRKIRHFDFESNKVEINMSDLHASSYYLRIITADKIVVKKVVKF